MMRVAIGISRTALGSPRNGFWFLGAFAFGFDLAPELVVGNASRFLDLTTGPGENCLKFRRVCQNEPLQFIVVGYRQHYGHRLAVRVTTTGPAWLSVRYVLNRAFTSATDAVFITTMMVCAGVWSSAGRRDLRFA